MNKDFTKFENKIKNFSLEELQKEHKELIEQVAQMIANEDAVLKLELLEVEIHAREED